MFRVTRQALMLPQRPSPHEPPQPMKIWAEMPKHSRWRRRQWPPPQSRLLTVKNRKWSHRRSRRQSRAVNKWVDVPWLRHGSLHGAFWVDSFSMLEDFRFDLWFFMRIPSLCYANFNVLVCSTRECFIGQLGRFWYPHRWRWRRILHRRHSE